MRLLILSLLCTVATALVAPICNVTLDPPQEERYGNDFNGVPLASNATIDDCSALCCATANCGSFSFNNPQPAKAFGCVQGDVCCMLKAGQPPLTNNTYGPSVRTGVVQKSLAPGPVPPFPPSPLITNVSFGAVQWWSGSGDTWPTAWMADGTVVGWACDANNDGKGMSPMSLFTIAGDPYTTGAGGLTITMRSNAPIDYKLLCAQYNYLGGNVKPAGMMAFPPNTLLVGASCMDYGANPAFNRQQNLAGFLAGSTDGGLTWTNFTPVGAFMGRLSAPVFVSCGRANDVCAAKDEGYLYVFFAGAVNNAAYWDNNDAYFLARVLNASVLNAAEYEFYQGLDGSGQPMWSPAGQPDLAEPVFSYGLMVGENGVAYHPYLQRYLMANFGFLDDGGRPLPWHQQPWNHTHRTQLLILEAPQPWGPWSLVYRDDNSVFQAPGAYTPTFPSAYMQPVVDGATNVTLFFSCLEGPPTCRYTLNWQTVTLSVNTSAIAAPVSV